MLAINSCINPTAPTSSAVSGSSSIHSGSISDHKRAQRHAPTLHLYNTFTSKFHVRATPCGAMRNGLFVIQRIARKPALMCKFSAVQFVLDGIQVPQIIISA